jgi:hypothetical protein
MHPHFQSFLHSSENQILMGLKIYRFFPLPLGNWWSNYARRQT